MKFLHVLAVALLLAEPAFAQNQPTSPGGLPGVPVDSRGGPTVDPTVNVLNLVYAAVTRLNDLMAAQTKRNDDLRQSDTKYEDALRDAETRRVNELAAQKQVFDIELARGIRANQDASALLLAGQVRELKTDTSDRIAKLEQFANEQRGRSSGANDLWIIIIGILAFLVAVGALVMRPHIPRPPPLPPDALAAELLRELQARRTS